MRVANGFMAFWQLTWSKYPYCRWLQMCVSSQKKNKKVPETKRRRCRVGGKPSLFLAMALPVATTLFSMEHRPQQGQGCLFWFSQCACMHSASLVKKHPVYTYGQSASTNEPSEMKPLAPLNIRCLLSVPTNHLYFEISFFSQSKEETFLTMGIYSQSYLLDNIVSIIGLSNGGKNLLSCIIRNAGKLVGCSGSCGWFTGCLLLSLVLFKQLWGKTNNLELNCLSWLTFLEVKKYVASADSSEKITCY